MTISVVYFFMAFSMWTMHMVDWLAGYSSSASFLLTTFNLAVHSTDPHLFVTTHLYTPESRLNVQSMSRTTKPKSLRV